jgi:hypothetical protein
MFGWQCQEKVLDPDLLQLSENFGSVESPVIPVIQVISKQN